MIAKMEERETNDDRVGRAPETNAPQAQILYKRQFLTT